MSSYISRIGTKLNGCHYIQHSWYIGILVIPVLFNNVSRSLFRGLLRVSLVQGFINSGVYKPLTHRRTRQWGTHIGMGLVVSREVSQ